MEQHELHFKKSLGQNFLTDHNILLSIVSAAELDDRSVVLEIGPGIGTLTQQLAKAASQVIAIELDQRFIAVLQENFRNNPQVKVLHGDALEIDFLQILGDLHCDLDHQKLHVVANLPYYVTTPIIMRLLELELPLKNIVVMIQKEVAQRIQAKPGTKEYGALSIAAQYYAEPEIVTIVPKTVFVPEPNVDSAVIKLTLHEQPIVNVRDRALFFQTVKAGFANRRKTLWNNFKNFHPQISPDEWRDIFQKIGIDPVRRGETLSIEEYANLSDKIADFLSDK